MTPIQKFLIIVGTILVVAGLLWPLLSNLGLGRLPGDIKVERPGLTFYFPITTMIIISIMITIIMRMMGR